MISHLPEFANTLQPYTPLSYLLMPRTRMDTALFFSSLVPSFPRSRSLPNPKRCETGCEPFLCRYQVAWSVAVATAVFMQPAVFATRVYASCPTGSTRLGLCTTGDDCHARENFLETLAVYSLKCWLRPPGRRSYTAPPRSLCVRPLRS